jgi:hypothetical protein
VNIQKAKPSPTLSSDLTNKSIIPYYKPSEGGVEFDEPMTVITPSHDVSIIGGELH